MKFSFEGSHEELQVLLRGLLTLPTAPAPTSPASASSPAAVSPPAPVLGQDFELGGPDDWKGHSGPAGPVGPSGGLPLPGEADMPSADDYGRQLNQAADPFAGLACSAEQKAEGWAHFVEAVGEWLQGWKQTKEIEREIEEPVRDENGKIQTNPKRPAYPMLQKVTVKEVVPVDQPDRGAIVESMGRGRVAFPIVILAREVGSLQRLVEQAIFAHPDHARILAPFPDRDTQPAEWLDFLNEVAGSMAQISHQGFPDLANTFDHSTRWRRS